MGTAETHRVIDHVLPAETDPAAAAWTAVGGAKHPAFASMLAMPASPPAFASEFEELALAAEGEC